MQKQIVALITVFALIVLTRASGFSQQDDTKEQNVWSGVYTDAQAARGKTQYEISCASCHRAGPAKGDIFMRDWAGTDLNSMFRQIKASMPADAPASLSDSSYVEIIAYILQVNAFPSGEDELESDILNSIRIEAKDGSEMVPNFSLIQVVGCLTQHENNEWLLIAASEPVRTKDPSASKDDALKNVQSKALGKQIFRLINIYPSPDVYKGHRVEAKGLLIRDPNQDRVNVTAMQSLAVGCDAPR